MRHQPVWFLLAAVLSIVPIAIITMQALERARAGMVSEIESEGRALATTLKWGDLAFVRLELEEREGREDPGSFVSVILEGNAQYPRTLVSTDLSALHVLEPGEHGWINLSSGRTLVSRVDLETSVGLNAEEYDDTRIFVGRSFFGSSLESVRNLVGIGWVGYLVLLGGIFTIYSWYRRKYIKALQRINAHLVQIGEAQFEPLKPVRGAPEIEHLTERINEMIAGLRSFLSGLVSLNSASVAHDVRTPLATMRSGLGQLKQDLAQEEFEALKGKQLARIDQFLARFNSIFELAQARANAGNISGFRELDLAALVQSIIEDYISLIQDEERVLRFLRSNDDKCLVLGDEQGVRRICENLINNARKYSAPGAEISVSIIWAGNRFELAVANTGGVFPDDIRNTAFEQTSRSRFVEHLEGLGLGLNHVRTIVAKHGWQVRISDRTDIAEVVISGQTL